MSRVRRNLEYYRLPTAIDADGAAAPENEYAIYENTDHTNGQIKNVTAGTAGTDAVNKTQMDQHIRADGTRAFTGNQSIGYNKLYNLADGTSSRDAVHYSQFPVSVSTANGGYFDFPHGYTIAWGQSQAFAANVSVDLYESAGTRNTDVLGIAPNQYVIQTADTDGGSNHMTISITYDIPMYQVYNINLTLVSSPIGSGSLTDLGEVSYGVYSYNTTSMVVSLCRLWGSNTPGENMVFQYQIIGRRLAP